MENVSYGTITVHQDEAQFLIDNQLARDVEQQPRSKAERSPTVLNTWTTYIILCAILLFVAFLGSGYNSGGRISILFLRKERVINTSLELSCVNEYGDIRNNVLSYAFLEGSLLVEPYRMTTLSVTNSRKDCTYEWSLSALSGMKMDSATKSLTGSSVLIELSETGLYNVHVSENCGESSESLRSTSKPLYVKYVRRELQSLNAEDRRDFLDALYILYTTSTKEGIELYGPRYKSLNYLTSIHVDAAGNPVCDEFHSGPGFFDNHVYFSNYLEQSLQLIQPRIALPYMEYSRYYSSPGYKQHMANQLDGGKWTELFSSEWFGSVDPFTGNILDGRFATVKIPLIDEAFYENEIIDPKKTFYPAEEATWLIYSPAHLKSPYGLLRPPWSYNPSPYISRYHHEAGIKTVEYSDLTSWFTGTSCDNYVDFLNDDVKGQSFDTFLKKIKSFHESVHFNTGGQGGTQAQQVDDMLRSRCNFTDDDISVIAVTSQKFSKRYISQVDYYTSDDYPVYPLNCTKNPWNGNHLTSSAAPGEEGGPSCVCVDYYFESPEKLYDLISMYFEKYMKSIYPQNITPSKILGMSFEDQVVTMKLLCSRMGLDGDMVGSASPLDPLFWVSHGSLERLYHRIASADLLSDYEYPTDYDCSGHAANGTKAWLDGYYLQDSSIVTTELTNAELTKLLNPNTDSFSSLIPYVYDASPMLCEAAEALLTSAKS